MSLLEYSEYPPCVVYACLLALCVHTQWHTPKMGGKNILKSGHDLQTKLVCTRPYLYWRQAEWTIVNRCRIYNILGRVELSLVDAEINRCERSECCQFVCVFPCGRADGGAAVLGSWPWRRSGTG